MRIRGKCLSAAKTGSVEHLRWRKRLWLVVDPPEFDAVQVVAETEPQHHFTELVRAQIVGVGDDDYAAGCDRGGRRVGAVDGDIVRRASTLTATDDASGFRLLAERVEAWKVRGYQKIKNCRLRLSQRTSFALGHNENDRTTPSFIPAWEPLPPPTPPDWPDRSHTL